MKGSTSGRRAKARYLQADRADKLLRRVEVWQQVEGIRAYCAAVEARYEQDAESAKWVSWARAYADRIDPLGKPPEMPAPPENVRLDELKPFLDGWSPYGPDSWR